MAFAEIRFMKREIEDLLNSTGNSLAAPSRAILEFVNREMDSIQEISKRLVPWSRADISMRTEVSKLGKVVKQIVESCEDQIILEIQEALVQLKTMGEKYIEELYNSLPEEEEDEDADHLPGFGNDKEMVGLVYEFKKLRAGLRMSWLKSTQVTALIGMAGIGKTALARKLFDDPQLVEYFECRVWVTLGRECRFREIPRRILAELNPHDGEVVEEGDEDIAQQLKEILKDKRFLVVLDDVWDKHMMHHLHSSFKYERNEVKNALHDENNGSQILFTSRLHQVDEYNARLSRDIMKVRLLNEEESWDLLRKKVFGEEACPFQLEKPGKKIAQNLDSLPLIIVVVANLLSKEEKTAEYWREVAVKEINHHLLVAAYDEISKVLLPSYTYIPKLLQMCFLYMGVFLRNEKISRSKLINMWHTDGFLEENVNGFLYPSAEECLEELVSNYLVIVHQTTLHDSGRLGAKQIKSCGLHSSLWHLSNKEARKIKFSYVFKTINDVFEEDVGSQCRLSFHNNILFGFREVFELVEKKCAYTAHSLLCYGAFQKYQVPICFGLRLLRKLDALTIRFYEFPMEILQLVQLRYLALTLNGELPASISQLSSLQFLIAPQYLHCTGYGRDPLHLPSEIWNMEKLKHLQVLGSDLPDPRGASLESLLTLSNVSAHSCSEAVLKAIPNIKKLGIQIRLQDDDNGSPISCFYHISHLNSLKSLKCVVMNPEVAVPSLTPMSIFPRNLTKLSLSGMGYPWTETSKISSLPCLQLLKLRNYAFQGPEWEVEEQAFGLLTILIIEDTDLEDWKFGQGSFDDLKTLTMKDCYNLERIHGEFGGFLGGIKLIDCNPLAEEEMKKATQDWKVDVYYSWDDRKLKK